MSTSLRNSLMRKTMRLFFKKEVSIQKSRERSEKYVRWGRRIPLGAQMEALHIGEIYAEWVVPPDADAQYVILYLHGGGYVSGSVATHKMLCASLAQTTGVRVLLLDYRVAPEHPFPAALDDALAAYRWLLDQGFEPENIIIAGDSAGGGLALATTLALREAGDPFPAAIVCISPWTDLKLTGDTYQTKDSNDPILSKKELRYWALSYTDEANLSNPLVSPVYADFHGFPPLLIQVGSEEILLDDALQVAEKAKAAGVDVTLKIWPEMWHVWHVTGVWLPEAREALDEIGKFVSGYFDAMERK